MYPRCCDVSGQEKLWCMRQAIFTAGYKAILHLHSLVEECEITKLLAQIDVKTKERKKV